MNVLQNFTENSERSFHDGRKKGWGLSLYRYRWLMLFVGLPTLISTIYYGMFASDQYVSQSRFVVKSLSQHGSQISTLANLIQTTGLSAGQEETSEILDYIRSRNGLSDLRRSVDVRAIFGSPSGDALARYPFPGQRDTFENLYKYYQSKTEVHLDHESGIAVLEVTAFTPEDARLLNEKLLAFGELKVNRLNDRARRKAIAEGERRVVEAEKRVRGARAALGRYRNAQNLIDPEKQAGGIFDVVTKLTSERSALQAQLDVTIKSAPTSPSIQALRSRIAAVSSEIEALSHRVVGQSSAIASKLGAYEALVQEQQFAAQALNIASASLEQAQTEAEKQQFYLERVVEPDTPDMALQPRRMRAVLTTLGATLCLYLVGWMLIVGILEHAPED